MEIITRLAFSGSTMKSSFVSNDELFFPCFLRSGLNPVAFCELCDFSKPASLFIYDGWRNAGADVAVDLAGFFNDCQQQ